jgi:hypothetical protein
VLFEGLYPTALYPLGLQDYTVSNNIVSLGNWFRKGVFSVVQSFQYNKSMCSYGEGYKLYDAICICSFMKRKIKPKELGLKSNTVACFWDIFFLGLYIILATNRHTIESF